MLSKFWGVVKTAAPILLVWFVMKFITGSVLHSQDWRVELVTYMILYMGVFFLINYWGKGKIIEETKPWYVVLEQLSEEEKRELKELKDGGNSIKAINKVRYLSGASLLEAKQYVDSL